MCSEIKGNATSANIIKPDRKTYMFNYFEQ